MREHAIPELRALAQHLRTRPHVAWDGCKADGWKESADEIERVLTGEVVCTGIEAAVCADIAARQAVGIAKYGTTVADNPLPLRDWLEHAYQETLDKAVYLKRAIAELDGQR